MLAPPVDKGCDTVTERDLRRVTVNLDREFGRLGVTPECWISKMRRTLQNRR